MAQQYEREREGAVTEQSAMGRQAGEPVKQIDQILDSVRQAIPDTVERTRKIAAEALGTVTGGIETSTDYLMGRGTIGIIKDTETLIRRYPFHALLLGFVVGFALSKPKIR
jgi:ElaB/YqjD/DUF883 family membrane-anchored ribosome-binding protein